MLLRMVKRKYENRTDSEYLHREHIAPILNSLNRDCTRHLSEVERGLRIMPWHSFCLILPGYRSIQSEFTPCTSANSALYS
ncbi:hypothetical protein AFLA_006086 [Aspergillus flavus NRRL3357]|nr:hypothetical protein AFLA_006086 [Aspergillus flavus NRRL3357]